MRVPAKLAAAALAFLVCLCALGMLRPERRGLEELHVDALLEEREDGLLELRLTWRWDRPGRELLPGREELLAVSFDTRTWLFESEEASYGVGVGGESLQLLDRVAGFNGARRFYVVPDGQDGKARVLLRPAGGSGGDPVIQIHAVVDPAQGAEAVWEMTVRAPDLAREGTEGPHSET